MSIVVVIAVAAVSFVTVWTAICLFGEILPSVRIDDAARESSKAAKYFSKGVCAQKWVRLILFLSLLKACNCEPLILLSSLCVSAFLLIFLNGFDFRVCVDDLVLCFYVHEWMNSYCLVCAASSVVLSSISLPSDSSEASPILSAWKSPLFAAL